ncbi:MAG: flagellar biosynthetic protein FliR [Lachnospiraceae bacterium]|nr:flagellar biosynthetic protein FliR [Lachnospiraceae bacterium]
MVSFEILQYDIEHYLLILVRIASFMVTAPVFSIASTTPRRIKIGFAAAIAFLVFPLIPREEIIYETIWQFAAIILEEAAVGVIIGFMANICINILSFAGRIIDTEIGFAMATQFDPTTRDQVSITGTLYMYFVMFLLLVTNMYQYVVRAIIDSYELIPVNGVQISISRLLELMLKYAADCFIIGFRIVLPFFTVMLLLNVILGILAKIAPQMNMFVVGMQLKVLTGLLVMVITAPLLLSVANFIFDEIKTLIVAAIQALS